MFESLKTARDLYAKYYEKYEKTQCLFGFDALKMLESYYEKAIEQLQDRIKELEVNQNKVTEKRACEMIDHVIISILGTGPVCRKPGIEQWKDKGWLA